MAFSHSFDTKAMIEFVVRRFQWDWQGKAFLPSPFPKDFRSLCLDSDLATAEQAAAQFELPKLPQVIFYAMLLNVAKRLGVLHGPRFQSLESTSAKGTFGDRCAVNMAFPPTHSMREMANYVREAFTWHGRNTVRPPRALPEDFNVLCPHFSFAEAETAAVESGMPEIVQAMFYAVLLNEMLELGAVHVYTAENMRSLQVGLRWSDFEGWMHIMDPVIRGAQLYRLPDEVEIRGARDSRGEAVGAAVPPAPSSDEE
ncbi:hypothetical protein Cgig2_016987 [Carnegiea gigantea]|uniref:Uncharacterized protein n=1 Tax=Carnegiea gigantea TaxID=171969 RepID=A0A9Q1QIX5_9CARY|nr:hypothetical protein Cgig2_016987 [Carnegiea gigantea]